MRIRRWSNDRKIHMHDTLLISRVAHVMERTGLAMSGAMCGTFVAALQVHANPALFDSIGFILSMVLIGAIGFYLGIDIPRLRMRPRVDMVELLSATGTFLAAVAALISVYAFVFDVSRSAPGISPWFPGGCSASSCRSARA